MGFPGVRRTAALLLILLGLADSGVADNFSTPDGATAFPSGLTTGPSDSGDLFVRKLKTVPPGASVTVDGRDMGTTPVDLEMTAGPHTLVLSLAGYETRTEELMVDRKARGTRSYTLEPTKAPSGKGWLTVFSLPPGATVFINKARMGVTPLRNIEVYAGENIVVVRSDQTEQSKIVQVGRNETKIVEFYLP